MTTTRSMKVRSFKNQEANRINARRLMRVSKKVGEANRRTLASVNRCIDKKLSQDMGKSTDIYTLSGKLRVEFVGKTKRRHTFDDDYDCDDIYQNPAYENEDHDNEYHGYDRTDGFIVDEDDPVIYESDEDEEVLSYDTDASDYDSEA